ncbi:hypothetical protein RHSIM_Rhsim02G0189400 [Rhododendron simsii]|uniref:Uncharacterized protein n=1 Tax=Rhododendron simsii TaxID=118357 RepID=A0A834HEL5_RHOSS|nr:hypothetical protein RHSIM_Rhsim02G0189400 [Rhododendron simsii]
MTGTSGGVATCRLNSFNTSPDLAEAQKGKPSRLASGSAEWRGATVPRCSERVSYAGWMRDKNLLQDGVMLEDHSSMEPQDEFGFTYANPHAQAFTQASQTQKGSSPKKAQRGGKLTIEEDMPCLVKSKRETLLRKIRFA